MRRAGWLVALIPPLVAGCAEPEKEWMKINQPYTAEEFRRDLGECTRGGRLDEGCMRSRGWVSVSPGKEVKPAEPPKPAYTPRR
jgi:hypothetical protein